MYLETRCTVCSATQVCTNQYRAQLSCSPICPIFISTSSSTADIQQYTTNTPTSTRERKREREKQALCHSLLCGLGVHTTDWAAVLLYMMSAPPARLISIKRGSSIVPQKIKSSTKTFSIDACAELHSDTERRPGSHGFLPQGKPICVCVRVCVLSPNSGAGIHLLPASVRQKESHTRAYDVFLFSKPTCVLCLKVHREKDSAAPFSRRLANEIRMTITI